MLAALISGILGAVLAAVGFRWWEERQRAEWQSKADARITEAVLARLAEDRLARDARTAQSVAAVQDAGAAKKDGDMVAAANAIIGGK